MDGRHGASGISMARCGYLAQPLIFMPNRLGLQALGPCQRSLNHRFFSGRFVSIAARVVGLLGWGRKSDIFRA